MNSHLLAILESITCMSLFVQMDFKDCAAMYNFLINVGHAGKCMFHMREN